jgi:hypothetical protein
MLLLSGRFNLADAYLLSKDVNSPENGKKIWLGNVTSDDIGDIL